MIQVSQHRSEFHAAFDLGHCFRIDAVRNERRADAVPGYVANQNVQAVIARDDKAVISADRPDRLIIRLDGNVSPSQALRCQTLLHSFRELELLFYLALAL